MDKYVLFEIKITLNYLQTFKLIILKLEKSIFIFFVQIGDSFEAKLTPGRSKLNAKIMDEAERWIA